MVEPSSTLAFARTFTLTSGRNARYCKSAFIPAAAYVPSTPDEVSVLGQGVHFIPCHRYTLFFTVKSIEASINNLLGKN